MCSGRRQRSQPEGTRKDDPVAEESRRENASGERATEEVASRHDVTEAADDPDGKHGAQGA